MGGFLWALCTVHIVLCRPYAKCCRSPGRRNDRRGCGIEFLGREFITVTISVHGCLIMDVVRYWPSLGARFYTYHPFATFHFAAPFRFVIA